jgi:hydrogenase large subunit
VTQHITINPTTRIEGHLRVDIEVDGGLVSDAWISATMWRGIETILRGRDAREAWLFAQRICGVCTTVHAIASVRAVEDALKLQIPPNAQCIRNLMLIGHALRDHAMHFYHLSMLDWIDMQQIARANVSQASAMADRISACPANLRASMSALQERVRGMHRDGRWGIFGGGYEGHPAMRLRPELDLIIFAHAMYALEFQRKTGQIVAILGGKTPHIQNLAVGGVVNAVGPDSASSLGMDQLEHLHQLIAESADFIQHVYLPDVCTLAAHYADWLNVGKGTEALLAVPDIPGCNQPSEYALPGGYMRGLTNPESFSLARFTDAVCEDSTHAYYEGDKQLHPWKGETIPHSTEWSPQAKYSWVKAARYSGEPAEVGPVAQIFIGYRQGHKLTVKWTDRALRQLSAGIGRNVGVECLRSTMGRHLARAIRAAMLAEIAEQQWQCLTSNIARGDYAVCVPVTFPHEEIHGVGIHEAPRGALSHWVVIENGVIRNYQAVVPSTWNASPRDHNGVRGPYETALLNTPIADGERPLEALRTIHSFDPCMACACQAFDAAGYKLGSVSDR